MKIDDMVWLLIGIGVIVVIAREPSLIPAFIKDVVSIPEHVSGYVRTATGAARENFRG